MIFVIYICDMCIKGVSYENYAFVHMTVYIYIVPYMCIYIYILYTCIVLCTHTVQVYNLHIVYAWSTKWPHDFWRCELHRILRRTWSKRKAEKNNRYMCGVELSCMYLYIYVCIYIYIYIHISSIYTVHVIIGYTYFSFCQNINIRTFYAHRVHVDNFACPKCHSSCSFHPRTAKDYSMSYCKTNFRTVFLNKLSRISKTSGKIRLFHTFPRTCQTKKKTSCVHDKEHPKMDVFTVFLSISGHPSHILRVACRSAVPAPQVFEQADLVAPARAVNLLDSDSIIQLSHMLHGAGIFTNICPKNHPVM